MGRRNRKLVVGVQVPPEVWAKFKLIVSDTGASINYCLERVLLDVIAQGRIPGVTAVHEQEQRENQKWGAATPVYSGEEPQPSKSETPKKKLRHASA